METITPFTAALLRWYEEFGRDLPWRRTKDPYAIWLSEIILQQTRVAQGEAYWFRFLERWPTVEQLAAASEDEVLRLWQGLGYYSRARHLHEAAQQLAAAGSMPRTAEEWAKLPGVGPYTAAAVASFAFGEEVAVVDGNVYRVLARFFNIATPIDSTEGKKLFAELARRLMPPQKAAEYNQALMDFGAIQCVPKSPECSACPLADSCEARRLQCVSERPVKARRTKVEQRRLTYIYIRCGGFTAIRRRGSGDFWQGLWEPWLVEEGQLPAGTILIAKDEKHLLTHRAILCDFYLLNTDHRPTLPDGYQWIAEPALDRYALPRLIEKLIERLNNCPHL